MKIGDLLIDEQGTWHKVLKKRGEYYLLSLHAGNKDDPRINTPGHLWTEKEMDSLLKFVTKDNATYQEKPVTATELMIEDAENERYVRLKLLNKDNQDEDYN